MIYSDEIIHVAAGEDDLLKNIEFDSEDLADGEILASLDSIAVKAADRTWETLVDTTDFATQQNGFSGTVAQVKITAAEVPGRFVIIVGATSSLGQKLIANCRVIVE